MSRFIFDLAVKSDELQLRKIFEENSVDGDIRMSFLRRPDVFQSIDILGENQVIVIRDTEMKTIIGCGIRSIRPMYVNGEIVNVGYMNSLRLAREYRNGLYLARAFKHFEKLHREDKKVRLYLTTLIENNGVANQALSTGRAGLPTFKDIGRIYTLGINAQKVVSSWKENKQLEISGGSFDNIRSIIKFVNETRASRQFSPYISAESFLNGDVLYRQLNPKNFFVAYGHGEIVGVLATWDQGSFKQNVIFGYSRKIKLMRPIYNAYAKFTGYATLPNIGEEIKSFYICCVAISENNPKIFEHLLHVAQVENVNKGYSYMLIGMHEKDNFLETILRAHPIQYRSKLMVSYWEDGVSDFEDLQNLVPGIEIAML